MSNKLPDTDPGLPYLNSDELQILFGYRHKENMFRAIQQGTFPVPTYLLNRRRVADREVVRMFFEERRLKGLRDLREKEKKDYSR